MGRNAGIIQVEDTRRFPTSRIKTGRILWQADFDYSVEVKATMGTVSITTAEGEVIRGSGSLKMETGAVIGNQARIQKNLAISSVIGTKNASLAIELLFGFFNTNVSEILIQLTQTDLSWIILSRVKWIKSTKQWQYMDSSGNYQNIPDAVYNYITPGSTGYYAKMSLDLENKKYKKFMVGAHTHDISANDLYSEAGSNSERIEALIQITTDVASPAIAIIDDMIISDMEN